MRQSSFFCRRYRTPAIVCLVLCTVVMTCLSAGCLGNLHNGGTVVSPRIVPAGDTVPPIVTNYSFPFERITVSFTMPVDGAVYAGAKAADKEVTIYGNVSQSDWIAQSYRSMMDDPSQEQFYTDIIARLRQVRDEAGLSDDEYVDLIAVFVQSIRYETLAENPPKFPIETFTERSGDCDDKSLLLGGILSREGYRTALFSFPAESHMAVGIACNGVQYKNSGYAYTETTNLSFVGVPPDGLTSGVVLSSSPIVIPVGNGNRTYGSCNQGLYIQEVYQKTETDFTQLSGQADTMRTEIRALASARNINAYNQRIPVYNSLIARIKQIAEVHNYILNHKYDRKGTYEYVKTRSAGL
jgi:hypothetical protein